MNCSALSPSVCPGCTGGKAPRVLASSATLILPPAAKLVRSDCASRPAAPVGLRSVCSAPGLSRLLRTPAHFFVTLRRRRDARLPSGAGLKQSRHAALRFRALAPRVLASSASLTLPQAAKFVRSAARPFPSKALRAFPGAPFSGLQPTPPRFFVTLRRRRDARLPSGAGLKQSRDAALRFRALALRSIRAAPHAYALLRIY